MKPRNTSAPLVASVVLIACSGCATLVSGTKQTITVDSDPPGALVRIGEYTGTTPVTLRIPKGKDYRVEVSRGADKRMVTLNRNLDPVTLLNLIPPMWPGFIIDAMTGAITKYDAAIVSVDFTREAYLTRFGY